MKLKSVVTDDSGSGSESNLSMACQSPSMIDLPAELLYKISGYLSLTTIAALCATCTRLHGVLEPELYKLDHSRGIFRTLSWAACARKPEATVVIERVLIYWPTGLSALQCHLMTGELYNGKSLNHLTPLMAAVQAGNHRVVYSLISKGVDIHQPETCSRYRDNLWYPIHHAMMMDHDIRGTKRFNTKDKLAIIKLLLSNGADPNQLSIPALGEQLEPSGFGVITPMHLAIMNQADSRVIDLLIESGASATRNPYHHGVPDQRFADISPISHLVNTYTEATKSHYLAVKSLVSNGAGKGIEAWSYTMSGNPLLHDSLWQPRMSTYSLAITKEILTNTCVRFEDRARNGDGIIVHHLKGHVAWKPSVSYNRRLVLRHEEANDMASVAAITCDTMNLLLSYGANINEVGGLGLTPLHVAGGLHLGYVGIFDHLLEKGADVRATTSKGFTVLHMLVMGDRHADYTLVSRLIRHYKLNRYAKDKDGNTFLHHLCTSNVAHFNKWMSEVAKNYKRTDFDNPKFRNKAGQTPYEAGSRAMRSANEQSSGDGGILRLSISHAFEEVEEGREAASERYQKRKALKHRNNPRKVLPTQSWKQKKTSVGGL